MTNAQNVMHARLKELRAENDAIKMRRYQSDRNRALEIEAELAPYRGLRGPFYTNRDLRRSR